MHTHRVRVYAGVALDSHSSLGVGTDGITGEQPVHSHQLQTDAPRLMLHPFDGHNHTVDARTGSCSEPIVVDPAWDDLQRALD